MVRKIGSNTPSIDPPELYDISSKMYAQMGQDVSQAASASMQALSGLNQAYDANARRQMALLAEQEELKAAQAKASQAKGKGGGLIEGLSSVLTGVMGGLAAQDELRQKQQVMEYKRMMDERKMTLDEQKFAYQQFSDQQKFELDVWKAETAEGRKQREDNLEATSAYVDDAVSGLVADLSEKMIGMTYEQGVAYTHSQIQALREQYSIQLSENPDLERAFNTKINEIRSDINQHYGKTMRDEIRAQDANYVEQMNSKLQLTFATRMNEIGASAGVWTAEEANQALNNVINQAVATVANDETFVKTINRNPALLGSFYKTLYDNAYVMFNQYSKGNAEIQATVQKIAEVNQIMGANIGNMDDPAVVSMLQEVFASKGLPWQNPREWGTSVVSTMKNQAETMELQQQLSVAVQAQDPMFGLDTGEQRIVAEAAVTRNIWDAENNKNGWNFMNLRGYYETELASAKESGDRNAEKVWRSNIQYLDTYEERQKQFKEANKAVQDAQLDYAKAVRPPDPNAVVNDPISGAPIRMTIGGNEPMQKYTPEEIQVFKDRLEDAHEERGLIVQSTAKEFGVNLENPADDSYINVIQEGALPYVRQLQQRNVENGRTTNTMGTIKNMQPPSMPQDDRQGAKPVNFSGGRVSNEQVVRGQTGTLPFNTTPVPLANAVPFQGGVATASNIGFVPFKGGTVRIVSKPDSKGLVLGSTDPRVATMMGGEVIYAGGTQTMGNVVVVKTKDGLAEVFGGLQSVNVQPGQFVKPGVALGSTQNDLEFQVWKTDNPLASLRMEIPRNETNPVAYLQGISGYRKAPDGLGTVDLLRNKPQPVGMGNSNVFAGDGYTIFGTILVDKKTGKQRQLTPKEYKAVYPNGMQQAISYAEQRQQEANMSYNQPLPGFSTDPSTRPVLQGNSMFELGKNLQAEGFQVLGYSPLGRNSRLGAKTGSYHASDMAMDINYDGKDAPEQSKLRPLYDYLRANADRYGIAELIYEDKSYVNDNRGKYDKPWTKSDHDDHLHVAFKNKDFAKAFNKSMTVDTKAGDPLRRRDSFEELADDPVSRGLLKDNPQGLANLRAFADIIAWAEGHGRPVQYNISLGWKPFDTSRPHPGKNAHGRYQYIPSTWKGLWGGQNPAMTPHNQDKAFIKLLQTQIPGLYEMVVAGDFDKAFTKATWIWASIKGNNYTYNGKPQGKYDPSDLANRARTAVKSYMKGDAGISDGRTPVTNAPLHQVNAAQSQSAYGKPSPNNNFGYPALVKNNYLRKSIYNVAVKTGVPQQMIADVVARQTANFTDVKGVNEATIRGYIGKQTVQDRIPSRRTPVTKPTPQQLIPDRRTPVGRSYTSGNARKKKEWHFNKRSNCPTCQSMPVFLPHFVYK